MSCFSIVRVAFVDCSFILFIYRSCFAWFMVLFVVLQVVELPVMANDLTAPIFVTLTIDIILFASYFTFPFLICRAYVEYLQDDVEHYF